MRPTDEKTNRAAGDNLLRMFVVTCFVLCKYSGIEKSSQAVEHISLNTGRNVGDSAIFPASTLKSDN